MTTKARIAQVARREFARRGFDATSIRQIVAEARVTKPVLYYYFKNKRDLFLSLLEEAVAPLCDEVERIARGGATPPRAGVRTVPAGARGLERGWGGWWWGAGRRSMRGGRRPLPSRWHRSSNGRWSGRSRRGGPGGRASPQRAAR